MAEPNNKQQDSIWKRNPLGINVFFGFSRDDADGLCTKLTDAVPNAASAKEDKAWLERETKSLRDQGLVIEDSSIQVRFISNIVECVQIPNYL